MQASNRSGKMKVEKLNADLACRRQVFNIAELREQILTYIILNDGGGFKEDTCSLRLVQKAWMNDVSRIMKKLGKPLYNLKLDENNSLNGSSYVRKHGTKALDNFVSMVALSPSRIENVIPPFSLSIHRAFFQDENRESFSHFLTSASVAGLVELKISYPEYGGSSDFLFDRIIPFPSFPVLREVSVKFHEEWAAEEDDSDSDLHDYDMASDSSFLPFRPLLPFLPFLQSVLNGACDLRKVDFQSNHVAQAIIPAGIKDLTLPRSLTELKLEGVLTNAQLEGLATNSLPNLTHLSLPIYSIVISNDLIFRILDHYRKTLRNLVFHGHRAVAIIRPKPITNFRFPVMESLQTFSTESVTAELEPGQHYALQTLLPALKSVHLQEQSVNMIRKWTDNSCFPTVAQLTVSLANENASVLAFGRPYHVTIHLEEIQALHMAFPNVSVLDMTVVGTSTRALKYVFMKMKQLSKLTIRVEEVHRFDNSAHWDSLLTAIPILVAETLATNSQFRNFVNTIDLKVDESSVANLNALGSLRLIAPLQHPYGRFISRRLIDGSLISDTVFHFAFLKMPNLKMLSLEGKFRASPEMTQVWEAEQRYISYSPTIADV